jgi:hypothetical protein
VLHILCLVAAGRGRGAVDVVRRGDSSDERYNKEGEDHGHGRRAWRGLAMDSSPLCCRETNRRKERILVDNQPLVQHLSDREDFISLAMFHQQAILAACFSLFGYKIVKAHFNTFDQF